MSALQSVLMVDDDQSDIFLAKRAFGLIGWGGQFNAVVGGNELFAYLGLAEDGSAIDGEPATDLPDVILLDLNMPRVNGFDVLKKLRESDVFRSLPVVVLTTSESSEDVKKAYESGANSFISKPSSPEEMKHLVSLIRNYWFGVSRLPRRSFEVR